MLGRLSDLDLRLIHVFIAIAEAGGVSPAQATLNVGQSTISTQLAALESRLGYRLCTRGRSGFELTAQGQRFLESSRVLLSSIEAFETNARNLGKKLVGSLGIGFIGHTPMSANARLSEAIARFRGREQSVHLSVSVRSPGELEELLLNGNIQVGIGYFWHRVPSLEYTEIFTEDQTAYCGRDHPLFARSESVEYEDVVSHEWAWRSYPLPESDHSRTPRNVTAMADNMEAVAMLVLSGRHLGYLPTHFASTYVEAGLLAPLNSSLMCYQVKFHLVTRRPPHRSAIIDAFVEDVKSVHLEV